MDTPPKARSPLVTVCYCNTEVYRWGSTKLYRCASSTVTGTAILKFVQAEFCPQIDTTVLASIIGDYTSEDDTTLTPEQVEAIRETLKILANHDQIHEYEEEMEVIDSFSNMSTTSPTTPELCHSTTTTSSGSDTSSSQHSTGSPLGFLQEAFLDVPIELLKRLLREQNVETLEDEGDVDMERVVECILTMESIRELQERGFDTLEPGPSPLPTEAWETVARPKSKPTPKLATPTRKKAKGRTIIIGDVRQKQHALLPPTKMKTKTGEERVKMDTDVDPWTYVSSLSSRLATLVSSAPASYFSSYFHDPVHATPASAIRAALEALPSSPSTTKRQTKSNLPTKQVAETSTLSALLELLQASPTFATLDSEQRETLRADARLALAATRNRSDEALDIVLMLWDPESNAGIYHRRPPPLPSSSNATPTARAKMPAGPPPLQPPPTSKRKSASSLSSPTSPTQSPISENPWHTVPICSSRTTHLQEDHNPAYKRKVRGAGNGLGQGGKGDDGELSGLGVGNLVGARHAHPTRGMLQAQNERHELLRKAGRAWQKWGGEAALYYTQRAREVAERARGEALDDARGLIEKRR